MAAGIGQTCVVVTRCREGPTTGTHWFLGHSTVLTGGTLSVDLE